MFVGNYFRPPRSSETQVIDPSYFPQFQKFRSFVEVIGDLITIGFLRIGCIGFLNLFAEDCENFSNLDRNLFPGYWEDNQRPPGYYILRLVVFIGTAC
ncbi:unnamed protein product [Citrullus colocynthis]|uniref:Uncharacterized protein n=1 Tax=Citrullus colocynthis TaxID=252529 RepID=A0ABP0Y489_9ROSI